MTHRCILFVVVLFFVRFVSFAQSSLIELNLDPKAITKGTLFLKDLVEFVDYIPLETKDNCLIGAVSYFDVSRNYILLHCNKSKGTYLFRRNGAFLCKIGKYGQGPGEYLQVKSVAVDELNKQILVFDHTKAIYYDLEGNYINSKSIPFNQRMILSYYDTKILTGLFSGIYSDSIYPVYSVFNRDGKLLTEGVTSVKVGDKKGDNKVRVVTFSPPMISYTHNGIPHVMEITLNDTLYTVNERSVISPKYVIKTGKYGITSTMRDDTDRYFDLAKDFVAIRSVNETNDYVFVYYTYKEKSHYCYYTKKTGTFHYFDSDIGIPNDYDGRFDFWAALHKGQKDKEFYTFYNATDFIEIAKKKKHEAYAPKEILQKIDRLIKKIDMEDNPVLLIVKMK